MTFKVIKANRQSAPISAAFIGESGSGKTYSALLFARGLVGPKGNIVVIDTEGRRALMYADDPEIGGFNHIDFPPTYSSERFAEAIQTATEGGADAIIIDSASHEHEAVGGMLEYADREEGRLGSKAGMRKWIKPKMAHNRYVRFGVSCSSHILFCLRQTRSTTMVNNKPVEMKNTVCEKNFIFEMMLAIELESQTHKATFVKVPKPFLQHIRNGEVLTVQHGKLLMREAGKGEAIDHQSEEIKRIAREVATMGTLRLKEHWEAQEKPARQVLQTIKDELVHIATEVDREVEQDDEDGFPGDIPTKANGKDKSEERDTIE